MLPLMAALTHIALHVRDLEACVAFYQDYCGLVTTHDRGEVDSRVVWLGVPGREREFALVLIPGGPGRRQAAGDYAHLGFACASKREVDAIAERAAREGRLVWPARDEAHPVGYYCGVRDPDGACVEFSYGQPLGPGAAGASN